MILLIIDTTGIQSYVFGSNRLRDNIGASHLVALATTTGRPGSILDAALVAEKGVEVVYAGGGNAMLLLREDAALHHVIAAVSRGALCGAPGLNLAYGWARMEGDDGAAFEAAGEVAFARLDAQKRTFRPQQTLLGLGVTALCAATRQPAIGMFIEDNRPVLAAAEVLAKQGVAADAHAALRAAFPLADNAGAYRLDYPTDFDNLGRSEGESSYIAVIHADGDGMGKRIEALLGRAYTSHAESAMALSAFSSAVHGAMQGALGAVVAHVCEAIGPDPKTGDPIVMAAPGSTTTVHLKRTSNNGPYYVPLRPIIAAGDDVTMVCDGRLGLDLAVAYLQKFAEQADPNGEPFSACAGVAIVNAHYPFAQAYALADDLCASAKAYRHSHGITGPCMDWHIATTGLGGTLTQMREREYTGRRSSDGTPQRLELRPVALGDASAPLRSWETVRRGINAFQGDTWQGRRGKAKALREALRGGSHAVDQFRASYLDGALLDDIGAGDGVRETGYQEEYDAVEGLIARCGYFDALELMDLYVAPVSAGGRG